MPVFIENIDLSILRAIDALSIPFLNVIAQALSLLAEHGLFPFLLTAVLIIPKKTRKVGICMLISLIFSVLITNLTIKPLVARPRPYVKYDISVSALLPHDYSFPSGHTSIAFAAAMGFAAAGWDRFRKWSIAGLVVSLLIGLSRIWLKVHYPSDVVVGLIIGVVCGLLAGLVLKLILARFPKLDPMQKES